MKACSKLQIQWEIKIQAILISLAESEKSYIYYLLLRGKRCLNIAAKNVVFWCFGKACSAITGFMRDIPHLSLIRII